MIFKLHPRSRSGQGEDHTHTAVWGQAAHTHSGRAFLSPLPLPAQGDAAPRPRSGRTGPRSPLSSSLAAGPPSLPQGRGPAAAAGPAPEPAGAGEGSGQASCAGAGAGAGGGATRALTRLFPLPVVVLLPLTSRRLPPYTLLDSSQGPLKSSLGCSCSPHSSAFCRR